MPASHYFNSTMVLCIAPPSRFTGNATVEVSNNGAGVAANFTTSQMAYTYDERVVLTNIEPPLGPTSGNFSVRINGGPFVDTNEIRCKFGTVTVLAVYIDVEEIHCFAPPHVAGRYALEVTLNDQDYTDARFPFFYYSDPALSRIMPVSGPTEAAGTEVTIFGNGFVNTSLLVCRFGYTVVPAHYKSDRKIMCETPPLSPESHGMSFTALSEQRNRHHDPYHGERHLFPNAHFYPLYLCRLVTVEVSNNGQDFTDSGINFLYQADAEVHEIQPMAGLDHRSAPLFIKGVHFVNSTSLRCRVGPDVVNATFLTRELVMCFALAQSQIEPLQGVLAHGLLPTPNFNHAPGTRYMPYVGLQPPNHPLPQRSTAPPTHH